MRKIYLLGLFSFIFGAGIAQDIESDPFLKGLQELLPGNWQMEIREGKLHIERTDSIWYFYTDWHKSAQDGKPDFSKGSHTVARLIYHLEPKWDDAKKASVKAKNEEITAKIGELEAKHDIQNLRRESRGRIIYVPRTSDDKAKITAFKMDERELLYEKVNFPDYSSTNYALFELSATGKTSNFDSIYPDAAEGEIDKIIDYMEQNGAFK